MKKIETIILNSFTDSIPGGNGAGVVLGLDFSNETMLKIAKKAGLSETAFIEQISDSTFKIRYFTPASEVDLCGHATIAAFWYLKDKLNSKNYKLKTKAGVVDINIGNIVTMSQTLPCYSEIIDKEEFLGCFEGLKKDDFFINMPLQVVSSGLRDIIVPIRTLKGLFKAKPVVERIIDISKKYNTIGVHLFTLETLNNSTAHTRNFAPLYDITEEAATGTANGALACYLYKYLKKFDFKNLVFEQGYCMNNPSAIFASLEADNNQIKKVSVGGSAVLVKKIDIEI